MSDFITLTCPSCGGRLEITKSIERFSCAHCGTEHMVKRGGGIVHLEPVLEKVSEGVGKTASELALTRLEKEIESIQIKIKKQQKVVDDLNLKVQNLKSPVTNIAMGFAGVTFIILGVVIIFSNKFLFCSVIAIVVGILVTYVAITTFGKDDNQFTDQLIREQKKLNRLIEQRSELSADQKFHREIVKNN